MPIIDIQTAVAGLKSGRVAAVPTETVYGLAGRIDRDDTLRSIFTIKQRPFFDPLIVHVESAAHARGLAAEWPEIYDALAQAFWPGPLTLVAKKTDQVSDLISSGLETVGLRCPRHPVALEILKHLGVPFAAPSANRFGRTSPTRAQDVIEEFGDTVDVVDGGASEIGIESTVLQAEQNGRQWRIHILRPGGVARAEIQRALSPKYEVEITRTASVASPGHLKAHYQPANPVVIIDRTRTDAHVQIRTALAGRERAAIHELTLPERPEQTARVLYAELRRLSQTPGVIVVHRTPAQSGEAWEAIWDRLERAAASGTNPNESTLKKD